MAKKVPFSEEEYIITWYFRKEYSYNEILQFLSTRHTYEMSLRTLKYRLSTYGLKRRPSVTANLTRHVDSAITEELQGSSSRSGYRTMWYRLNLFNVLRVPRDLVMRSLQRIDPEGCRTHRRRRLARRQYFSAGPNDTWHIDSYDKLKPFGFPIHGYIDGFSHRIMWLKVLPSNNNPGYITSLFIETVKQVNGLPKRLRSDCGTENVTVAAIQSFLRRNHEFEGSYLRAFSCQSRNRKLVVPISPQSKFVHHRFFQRSSKCRIVQFR